MHCNINQIECFPEDEVVLIMTRLWPWLCSDSLCFPAPLSVSCTMGGIYPDDVQHCKRESADPTHYSGCIHPLSALPCRLFVHKNVAWLRFRFFSLLWMHDKSNSIMQYWLHQWCLSKMSVFGLPMSSQEMRKIQFRKSVLWETAFVMLQSHWCPSKTNGNTGSQVLILTPPPSLCSLPNV